MYYDQHRDPNGTDELSSADYALPKNFERMRALRDANNAAADMPAEYYLQEHEDNDGPYLREVID